MSRWDPEKYLEFETQRTQPAIDLALRVRDKAPLNILDIGCGPGNSTAVLHNIFPDSHITGIDNSAEMIDKARARYPEWNFEVCSATQIEGEYDLIFSNACLQWVPDHRKLLPGLFDNLSEKGVLAVQIPMNADEPIFRIMDSMVKEDRWGIDSEIVETNRTLLPEEYFDVLASLTEKFNIWETVYYHKMPSVDSMVEWIKGTRLRPYINVMEEEKAEALLTSIRKEAEKVYSVQENGEIIFRFHRFFFTAEK